MDASTFGSLRRQREILEERNRTMATAARRLGTRGLIASRVRFVPDFENCHCGLLRQESFVHSYRFDVDVQGTRVAMPFDV